MVSTAKLCRNENANAVTAMGIEYCEFNLMSNCKTAINLVDLPRLIDPRKMNGRALMSGLI